MLTVRPAGFPQVTRWRGSRLSVHNTSLDPTLLRTYDLEYETSGLAQHSLLAEVRLAGYLFDGDPGGDPTIEEAPALRFDYTSFAPERTRLQPFRATRGYGPANLNTATCEVVDLEGAAGWKSLPRPIPRRRDDPTFPEVSFADPRVRLADMTGDGLLDMVRVFKRHIEYWPSLGPGRRDERRVVLLPGDGPKHFHPTRCFLADVNGDGVTDVVYVDGNAIYLWVSRQGESMSPAIRLRYPPPPAPGTVRTTDMLATGTAGLLFSLSHRAGQRETYRYLDFTGSARPTCWSGSTTASAAQRRSTTGRRPSTASAIETPVGTGAPSYPAPSRSSTRFAGATS